MKILVVGSSNTFFIRTYVDFFLMDGHDVGLYDVGWVDYSNEELQMHVKSKKGVSGTTYNKVRKIFKYAPNSVINILRLIKRNVNSRATPKFCYEGVDVVFYFWGDTLLKEKDMLSKKYHDAKHILSVNTFPTGFEKTYKLKKNIKNYFNSFDKLLVPTKSMFDYLEEEGITPNRLFLYHDFIFKERIFPKKNVTKIKKICFLGNVLFENRQQDDISILLEDLNLKGYEVWTQGAEYSTVSKQFKPFTYDEIKSGDLNKFLFDNFHAVLYAYSGKSSLRESMSLTTRFVLFEGCGLPIILDKSKYAGIVSEFSHQYKLIDIFNLNELLLQGNFHNYDQSNRIERLRTLVEK